MRFLGVDHGSKRIGLASGDELGLATPLPALVQPDPAARWTALLTEIANRRIHEVVMGHPINMDGSAGPKAREVEAFAERLRVTTSLPVHLIDERLTSHAAEATLPKHKLRELRSTGEVDSRAAAIILQDYLDQRFPAPLPEEDSF